MLEPSEDLLMLFDTLGDTAEFQDFALKVIPGQMTANVPDYHSIHDQSRTTLWLAAITTELRLHGVLDASNRFVETALWQFTLNGLQAQVLAATPDPTGYTLMGCTYV